MAKRFLPSKAWEWGVAAPCVIVLGAIFFPVYAYSGPGLSHGRIARDLGRRHRLGTPWYRDEKEYALSRIPPGQSYSYAFRGAVGHGAIYRIVVDGRAEIWRVNDDERSPKRLAAD